MKLLLRLIYGGILLLPLSVGCGGPADEMLHCRDLLSPSQVDYDDVAQLVTSQRDAGCASCHNTITPVGGYNFQGPAVSYDALTTKTAVIYTQVASGAMPQGGPQWTARQLQLLRSWYCHGGAYE